ncbi:short-chain dehydrogenase/reductase SDR [Candidatus Koribacter versatilis Ellin345]|uniref:Short-chain dehydrogenase/reductase SDR n=1 Tax=Koribacter versatilis (strain Ellin345) TaxID=204669 RepID=Q1IVH3_KORVE|nr:glucose 1-dehydrogenase [Candidatus Koribacter versatilis]ABF39127.1 short-chain dehydrogenase/reductase SDR [Candidatus Koribacter versatilis Ellin345]
MSVPMSLNGKVALVTGGSRGIGAAIVRLFVQAGAKVVFNYQRAADAANQLVAELGVDHCFAVQADLSNIASAGPLVEAAVAKFGAVDIMVANHGLWPPEDIPINEIPDEHWRNTLSINLDSVFGLIKHTVAQMKQQGRGGHIVLISSTSGQRGEAFHVDYSASKGALISMTKGLATELARYGIYVNAVAPGWVNTDMSASTLVDPKADALIYQQIPLGRVGKPEEIAAPVLFLCTPMAGFITGEIFNVNGGAVLVG